MSTETPSSIWGSGDAYERYVGRWSRRVAPIFLSWLAPRPGKHWLDVGCGTGALSEAIVEVASPASVIAIEPADGFRDAARRNLADRADVRAGTAAGTGLTDASIDIVVSGLVLNFVPDAGVALAEMSRVTKHGGTIAAYVWDYGRRMELMRHFWDAAVALDPAVASVAESHRFALCNPGALRATFSAASLSNIDVTALDIATEFRDFDDYWEPFLGGQGPAPAYLVSLEEEHRSALRERLRVTLPTASDGSIPLVARAWAVRGTNP